MSAKTMIASYSLRAQLRARGRTALFAGLIFFLTLALTLGFAVRSYCDAVLRQSDGLYRSIALVEYMGAEYPEADEPDAFARAAFDALDAGAIRAIPGVKAWQPADQSLVNVAGYTRLNGKLPYRTRAVLTLFNFLSPTTQPRQVEVEAPTELNYVIEISAEHLIAAEVHQEGREPVRYSIVLHENGSDVYTYYDWTEDGEREITCGRSELPGRYCLETFYANGSMDFETRGLEPGELDPYRWSGLGEEPGRYLLDPRSGVLLGTRLVPVAYTAFVGDFLYSRDYSDGIMLDLPLDSSDFLPEKGKSYLVNGEFLQNQIRSIPSFQIVDFATEPGEKPWVELSGSDDPRLTDSAFTRAAELYDLANNYVRLERADSIADLTPFQQGVLHLEAGRFPEPGEDACVVSGDLAEQLGLHPGDSITVTGLESGEEDRFALTGVGERGSLTVAGLTNFSEDYRGWVWMPGRETPAPLFGYTLGVAVLDNARGEAAAQKLQAMMPENVRATLLDQGYAQAVQPFRAMRATADRVLLACCAGVLAVLVLFSFLFVGRQQSTVQILTALGTPRRGICLWLLSGAALIAGLATALAAASGAYLLPALMRRVNEAAEAARSGPPLYSETALGVALEQAAESGVPYGAALLAACCVLVLALLLCALFLRRARRAASAQRGRIRVRVPRGKTSAFGSGSLRFALLSLRRGGLRSLIVPLVSLALTLLILVVGGSLGRWEADLGALDDLPVEGQAVSTDGKRYAGLVVSAQNARLLSNLDMVEDCAVSKSWHYWLPEEMPAFAANEFGAETRLNWIQTQPELVALNSLRAAKEFYYTEPELSWLEGWDESCLADAGYTPLLIASGDWERALPAVASREFLEAHGLSLGDRFLVLVYWQLPWATYEIAVPLRAVASYKQTGAKATMYVPLAAYVQPDWIFGDEALDGLRAPAFPRTEAELEMYLKASASFSTCRFRLRSAGDLAAARAALREAAFSRVGHLDRNRCTLVLRDGSYLKTRESLARNLSLGRRLFPAILALVALVGLVVSWLMIHGRKEEFALMRGFGAKRGRVFFSFFLEQTILCLAGCGLGCLGMLLLPGAGEALGALALYLLCYLLGCAVSVLLVGRMRLMDLIADQE